MNEPHPSDIADAPTVSIDLSDLVDVALAAASR